MKRMLYAIPGLLLFAMLLAGCGEAVPDADESVVYVNKKGVVTYLDVEPFDQGVYEEEGLRGFLEEEIKAYTDEHGKNTVKLEDLTVEDGIAKLRLTCQSAQDFAQYNGIEMYQGRIVDALAAGYVFDGTFAKVENGTVTGEATKQEIYTENEMNVVIIRANMDVRVEGEICYVSCQNVSLTGPDGVSIRPEYYLGDAPAATGAAAGGQAAGSDVPSTEEPSSADDGNAADATEDAAAGEDGSDGSVDETDDGDSSVSSEDSTQAGMVIDADTSGTQGGADAFGASEQGRSTEVYTFIVYR